MPKSLRDILQNKCLNISEQYCLVTSTLFLTKNFVWWYISGRKVQRDDILWEDKSSVFNNRLRSEFKRRRELLSYIKFEQMTLFVFLTCL